MPGEDSSGAFDGFSRPQLILAFSAAPRRHWSRIKEGLVRPFLWNGVLAFVWALVIEDISLPSLALGFVLGYAILWMTRRVLETAEYCARVPRLIEFVAFFVWELVWANLRVAYDVITPKHHMRPAIIALTLDAQTDLEITLLANLISLTPGTLSLDVSPDRKALYIHHMYVRNPDVEKQRIKNGFERRLLKVLR